jgi:hypothetical protein
LRSRATFSYRTICATHFSISPRSSVCKKTITLADNKKLEEIVEGGVQFYADDMKKRGMMLY